MKHSVFDRPRPGSPGPLSGVRVLDLSAYIAGPYGCTLLADQGADVVKVEPPGDNLRHYPSTLADESRAFLGVNRSKRGVVLNLKQAHDRAALYRMVREADVLVHNFRPGVSSALYERERSGEGQHVGISLLRSALTMQSARMIWAENEAPDIAREMHSGGVTGLYPTKAGYLYVSANTPRFWQALCEKTGMQGLLRDARFASVRLRAPCRGVARTLAHSAQHVYRTIVRR